MARTGSYPVLLPSLVVREAFVYLGTSLGSVYCNPQFWLAFPVESFQWHVPSPARLHRRLAPRGANQR